MASKLRGPGFLRRRLLLVAGVKSADEGGSPRRCHILKPGENSPHIRRRRDFVFRVHCLFRPGGFVARHLGSWVSAGGRVCARSFLVSGFGGHEHRGSSGSRIDAALEVVGTARDVVEAASSIIHSGGEDWRAQDFPFLEVVSRSGVCRRTGGRDLSGVRDRSGVRRTCD